MQITVKETKVLSTGTNATGTWELIKVVSDDGTEYTTFDQAAKHLTPGSVIDIGEIILKQGKPEFKKVENVVKKGTGISTEKGTPTMTKDGWGEKDRIERASIEAQVAVKAVAELVKAGVFAKDDPAVQLAIKWCGNKISAALPELQPVTVPKIQPEEKIKDTPLKNLGELLT